MGQISRLNIVATENNATYTTPLICADPTDKGFCRFYKLNLKNHENCKREINLGAHQAQRFSLWCGGGTFFP